MVALIIISFFNIWLVLFNSSRFREAMRELNIRLENRNAEYDHLLADNEARKTEINTLKHEKWIAEEKYRLIIKGNHKNFFVYRKNGEYPQLVTKEDYDEYEIRQQIASSKDLYTYISDDGKKYRISVVYLMEHPRRDWDYWCKCLIRKADY